MLCFACFWGVCSPLFGVPPKQLSGIVMSGSPDTYRRNVPLCTRVPDSSNFCRVRPLIGVSRRLSLTQSRSTKADYHLHRSGTPVDSNAHPKLTFILRLLPSTAVTTSTTSLLCPTKTPSNGLQHSNLSDD
ncbi:hypothetical protein GQ43DRAFT_304891 [Delitschia confertaspora ATCC 74209]|uniref:Secreted protein n=1 Tax=Delitschia confertaspora ATCC 74209 TaxID=1513339 RepID=A0A9P4JP40_9PLEO|nr:hypothetical protein GQ43DRAFT_304891 [Delitschia confertaspora ATCC 74209]